MNKNYRTSTVPVNKNYPSKKACESLRSNQRNNYSGGNKEAPESLLPEQFRRALKVPPYKFQLERFQRNLKEHFKGTYIYKALL